MQRSLFLQLSRRIEALALQYLGDESLSKGIDPLVFEGEDAELWLDVERAIARHGPGLVHPSASFVRPKPKVSGPLMDRLRALPPADVQSSGPEPGANRAAAEPSQQRRAPTAFWGPGPNVTGRAGILLRLDCDSLTEHLHERRDQASEHLERVLRQASDLFALAATFKHGVIQVLSINP